MTFREFLKPQFMRLIAATTLGVLIVASLTLILNANVSAKSDNDPNNIDPTNSHAVKTSILEMAQLAKAAGLQSQFEALEDGEVTRSEYEDAINRVISCSREAGLNVTDTEPDWSGKLLSYGVIISSDPAPSDPGIEAHDKCYDELAFFVDQAFSLETFGDRQNSMADAVECIASFGVDTEPMYGPGGNLVPTKVLELAFEEFNLCTTQTRE